MTTEKSDIVTAIAARADAGGGSGVSPYDTDIVTWCECQAALLRRIGAGEKVNGQVDWENVAEEIESVGQSQVDAVESLLFRAFQHMLMAAAWPLSDAVPHWQSETRGSRAQARRKYRLSMAQKIDLPGLYADALYAMPETIDGQQPLPVDTECPVTLDQLLAVEV
jgi:Domain of unknown function DUF29